MFSMCVPGEIIWPRNISPTWEYHGGKGKRIRFFWLSMFRSMELPISFSLLLSPHIFTIVRSSIVQKGLIQVNMWGRRDESLQICMEPKQLCVCSHSTIMWFSVSRNNLCPSHFEKQLLHNPIIRWNGNPPIVLLSPAEFIYFWLSRRK